MIRWCRLGLSLALAAGVVWGSAQLPAAQGEPWSTKTGVVRYAHDRLTLDVKDAPLAPLLQEIARQAGITVSLLGTLEGGITISFRDLSLDESLRRILRRRNFALEYDRSGKPERLWISPASAGGPDAGAGRREQEYAGRAEREQETPSEPPPELAAADPTIRGAAVEALGDGGERQAVGPLMQALRDPDEEVRQSAIMALASIGSEEATAALGLALRDEAPWLREVAVTALGQIGTPSAVRLLRQALSDSDEGVRQAAAAVLEQLPQ